MSTPQTADRHMEAVYLTAAQVAEVVQVDQKTILRWSLEDASMPVLRRGRVVRFPRERLLTWLERQEPRASAHRRRKAATDDASHCP
jgi:excisionase family DNA binding protein